VDEVLAKVDLVLWDVEFAQYLQERLSGGGQLPHAASVGIL
jgi:hypothetical protein